MLSTFAYKNLIDADPPFGHFYIKATSFPRIFDVTLVSQGIHQLREAAQGVWLLIGNNSFCRVNGPERRGYDFYFYSSSLFLTLCANQEWGHIYIYTHTVLTFFEGSFVELIEIGRTRSFLSPHKVGEMSWRGDWVRGKLLEGIVNEFPFQMPFPGCLKFGSYEKEIFSVFSVGQNFTFGIVDELIFCATILAEEIPNKFNLFQTSFSSHWIRITRKRNFLSLMDFLSFSVLSSSV